MNKLTSTLHEATHRVPGVPAHPEEPVHARRRANHGRTNATHRHGRAAQDRHQKPPRVLVGWQNWIGRVVGTGDGSRDF